MIHLALKLGLAGSLLLSGGNRSITVHPLHTTMTEVQEDSPGRIKVTVRGFADDLATGAARYGRLDAGAVTGARGDTATAAYVLSRVALSDRQGRRVILTLRDIRRTADILWFTFDAPAPGGIAGFTVVNQALWEVHEDQVNIVQVLRGSRRQTFLFTPGTAKKTIS